ncbi:MAG: carboxypeptidase-like regulatory domain-containing protein [Bacteroidota bacterium]|nr:carboxypeptidase-like regulatory domain-containing protein [Bacteroidota bacterium]
MKAIISSIIFVFLFSTLSIAGNEKGNKNETAEASATVTISGVILDQKTSEELPGATVIVEGTSISVSTDLNGNFEIKNLKPGKYNLKVSYIAYKDKSIENLEASDRKENLQIEIESL